MRDFVLASVAPLLAIILEVTNAWPDSHVENEISRAVERMSSRAGSEKHLHYWSEGLVVYRSMLAAGLAPIISIMPLMLLDGPSPLPLLSLVFSIVFLIVLMRLAVSRDFFSLSAVFVGARLRVTPSTLLRVLLIMDNVITICVIFFSYVVLPQRLIVAH